MTTASETLDQLAARAVAAERACQWDTGFQLYGELFSRCVEARAVARIPGALMGSARVLSPDTSTEEAEELAWLAHEIAQRTGRIADAAVSLNLIATLLHQRNDLDGARQLYARALERARDLGDDALVAKTCLNLGVIDAVLGNLREARARYLESVSAGIRSGEAEHAMRAYNNLGMVCTDLGEWVEAQLHLDRGIEIAERLEDLPMQTVLHNNRVEPLIHLGDLNAARAEADLTEALARRVGRPTSLADVGRFRGIIAMAEDRLDDADQALRGALALTEKHDLELCRAEVLEQIAHVRRRQGRDEEAVAALDGAFEGFFALGAKRDVTRVAALLEEWREAVRQRVRIGGGEPGVRSSPTGGRRHGAPDRRRPRP